MANQPEILTKPFELGYTYTRSTGPLIGRFLTELREGRITARGADRALRLAWTVNDLRGGSVPELDDVAQALMYRDRSFQ